MGYTIPKSKKIRAYFNKLKKSVEVSSIEIAAALGKTNQNIADLSGRVDNFNLREIAIICDMLDVEIGEFVRKIIELRREESGSAN